MTDKAMRERIKQNVHEVDPQAEVWLYGSRARETAREDSDWDVLVYRRSPRCLRPTKAVLWTTCAT